jgi:hypothetical protein
MAEHTYQISPGRRFVILTRGMPLMNGPTAYTVESVTDNGLSMLEPGVDLALDGITSSSEETVYTRACEQIDQMVAFEGTYEALAKYWAAYQLFSARQQPKEFEDLRKHHAAFGARNVEREAWQGLNNVVDEIAGHRRDHPNDPSVAIRQLERAWAHFEAIGAGVSRMGQRFPTAFRILVRHQVTQAVPPGIVIP